MQNNRNNNSANKLSIVLSVIYLIVLCWILLFKLGVRFSYMENRTVNLVPFGQYLNPGGKVDLPEIIMNVIIFIPLGVYAGILFKRWTFAKSLFFFFSFSFLIEALQFIFKIGAFDITDTITNTVGGATGLIIYKTIEKISGDSVRSQKFVNIVASIGTALMVLFLILLKTNNLWIRYQ